MRKKYLPSADIIPLDQRCIQCRNPLNRIGRYCARCLRSQRLKLIFGTAAAIQIAAAAVFAIGRPKAPDILAAEILHVTPVQATAPGSRWAYYDVTDPLIDDVTHHAKLAARSLAHADGMPPNPAAAGGILEVSSSIHYGTSIVLRFAPVHRNCTNMPCQVTAIFDQNPARQLPYRDVSDEDGTVLMMSADQGFVDDLLSAHDLTITASLGSGQDAVLSFDVSGFRMRLAALRAGIRYADAQAKKAGASF